MLDRLGTGGGGTAGAERVGMIGGPVIAGCPAGTTFGLGGMFGASVSPLAAVCGTAGAWLAESARLSRRGIGTAAAASGRGAGTGTGGLAEFLTGMAASGLAAGTGTCVFPAGILAGSFPAATSGLGAGIGAETPGGFLAGIPAGSTDGSTPTGRLAGSGGGGPRLAKPGGSAGGKLVGGGIAAVSESLTSATPELSAAGF